MNVWPLSALRTVALILHAQRISTTLAGIPLVQWPRWSMEA